MPAVVGQAFLDLSGAAVGDEVAATISGQRVKLAIIGATSQFPSLDPTKPFAIVDATTLERARQATTGQVVATKEWWLSVDPAAARAVEESLRQAPIAATEVVGRASLTRSLASDPISLGIIGALGLGALAALAFASIGFLVSAVVTSSERITEFAILRALGLSGRELSTWVTLENAFLLVFGLVAGTVLGIVLSWLVLPFATLTETGEAAIPTPEIVVPWAAMAPLYARGRPPVRSSRSRSSAARSGRPGSAPCCDRGRSSGRRSASPSAASATAARPSSGCSCIVLVTAVCAALAPRLFDQFADDALRGEVREATPFQRNIQLSRRRSSGRAASPTRCRRSRRRASTSRARCRPASARSSATGAISPRRSAGASSRTRPIRASSGSGSSRTSPTTSASSTGRPPTDATRTITVPSEIEGEEAAEVTVLEVALSAESLERIGLSVGDTWLLRPDETDRLVGRGADPMPAAVDVVGSFEPIDPDEEYWLDDTALIRPSIRRVGDNDLVDMTAMIDPQAYDELITSTAARQFPVHYAWRYFTDAESLQSEQLPATVADLRRLDGTFSSASGPVVEGTLLQSGLLPLLESVEERWASVAAVLAVVGARARRRSASRHSRSSACSSCSGAGRRSPSAARAAPRRAS